MTIFKVTAEYYRKPYKNIKITVPSHPEPYEDLKILQNGYEKHYKLKSGDIVIDGGAYIGLFSIYAGLAVAHIGHVFAFEPTNFITNAVLNIRNNNLIAHVTLENMALWKDKRELVLNEKGPESTVMSYENTSKTKISKVASVSIDEYIRDFTKYKTSDINFIKLDVEGSELNVLKGAEEVLKESNVKLAIATYHNHEGYPTYTEIEDYLKELNFHVKTECSIHLTTYASRRKF